MKSSLRDVSVQVGTATRPIKIVFLVPDEETEAVHWILDAVFREAYSRWGGASSLIIPSSKDGFSNKEYSEWIASFDPDFIYSYVDLEEVALREISDAALPVGFLKHESHKIERWSDYTPRWSTYFEPVPSLSTLLSPYAELRRHRAGSGDEKRILVTQYCDPSEDRFLADNFGVSHSTGNYTNPSVGFFETLCFVGKVDKGNVNAGTEELKDVTEILKRIVKGDVTTFSQLSRIHSKGIPKVEAHFWSGSFSLFVGDTCKDRINFWNARNLGSTWSHTASALIVKKEVFENNDFLPVLGAYLNAYNFTNSGNGPSKVSLRSSSVGLEEMKGFSEKLRKLTYNYIEIDNAQFKNFVFPTKENFERAWTSHEDAQNFRLNERESQIEAAKPAHFKYTPAKFDWTCRGDWAIELDIERHKSHSKYSNVVDTWRLPRRRFVSHAFTDRLAKVSKGGRLVLIPQMAGHGMFRNNDLRNTSHFKLYLPDDDTVFRYLVIKHLRHDPRDLRSAIVLQGYDDLSVSDKGQNLRGIVSMFDRFQDAYELLTNSIWRTIFRTFYRKDAATRDELFSSVPSDFGFKNKVAKYMSLPNAGRATSYIKACFDDTLEYLVEKKLLFQVHKWRCSYCGNNNILSIDELKKRNACSVCDLEHFCPINPEWNFKINSFVSGALCERHGYPVLWALGWLHARSYREGFYFLPEVDLFPDANNPASKEEIDILCVVEGKFLAVEVKKSATQLTRKNDEVEKFIKKMKLLQPDVAMLMFEDWAEKPKPGEEAADVREVKRAIEEILGKVKSESGRENMQVGYEVATEVSEFRESIQNLGIERSRAYEVLARD